MPRLIAALLFVCSAGATAYAQNSGAFVNDYERAVFCSAAIPFVSPSGHTADFKALQFWLSKTTVEGTRRGFSQDQNRQAVDKKVLAIESLVGQGGGKPIKDLYAENCGTN